MRHVTSRLWSSIVIDWTLQIVPPHLRANNKLKNRFLIRKNRFLIPKNPSKFIKNSEKIHKNPYKLENS